MVTPEEFDTLDQDKLQYNYSWIYDKQPKTEKEEKDVSEELMENIGEIVTLEAFVPRYLNQAITFTGEDMGSDKANDDHIAIHCNCHYGFCIRNYYQ